VNRTLLLARPALKLRSYHPSAFGQHCRGLKLNTLYARKKLNALLCIYSDRALHDSTEKGMLQQKLAAQKALGQFSGEWFVRTETS
jgi:hypothetical protein